MKRFSPRLPERVDHIFEESDKVIHQTYQHIYEDAMNETIDRHHILHYGMEWSLRPEARYLRENAALIPRMYREDHNELHRQCPPIPLLGHYALLRTVRAWHSGNDSMESLENLMFAIQESNKSPKAFPIERDLGDLAIRALDLQRPYLQHLPQ